jgi:hypothetical protein
MHKTMLEFFGAASTVLGLGIGLLAFTIGFMVGNATNSVANVAVPALFGIVVGGLGVISVVTTQKSGEEVGKLSLERHMRAYGAALMLFSAFYLFGTYVGLKAKIQDWMAPPPPVIVLPWEGTSLTKPPTAQLMIDWIALSRTLHSLGYTAEQIRSVYLIQVDLWSKNKNADAEIAGRDLDLSQLSKLVASESVNKSDVVPRTRTVTRVVRVISEPEGSDQK